MIMHGKAAETAQIIKIAQWQMANLNLADKVQF